jgi:drug/metabolite transporter (DMT)-like permease
MTISGSFGAMFFKQASQMTDGKSIMHTFFNPRLYFGGLCYVLGAFCNILLLAKLDYSVVYPMSSLTYVWTMVISYFLLHESVTRRKVIAVLLIVVGISLLNISGGSQ